MKFLIGLVIGAALGFIVAQKLMGREPAFDFAAMGDDSPPPVPQDNGMTPSATAPA